MRSRGRMLVLISTVWAQRTKRALTRALIGGTQPVEGWWAPVAQHTYKRKRWGLVALCPKFVAFAPPTETLADRGCTEAAGSSTGAAPASRHRHRLLHHAAVMRLCVVNGFMEDGGWY